MVYPYMLYDPRVKFCPVFPNLQGPPFVTDLSAESTLLTGINPRDQKRFQKLLEEQMGDRYRWGVGGYLERRDTLLADCPQMVKEKRFIHLGLDVIVDLGTPLQAPLDAIVEASGYEEGEGNYGGYVLLKHISPLFDTFYSFYGHLCKDRLPSAGTEFGAGAQFAEIGNFHENGNWFYHTHIQVLTAKGYESGYISKGYCADADLKEINSICPSPIPLFKVR